MCDRLSQPIDAGALVWKASLNCTETLKVEKQDVLGLDAYCGCFGGLGGFESLGPPQARGSDLNVRFLWGWRSLEEKARFEARMM